MKRQIVSFVLGIAFVVSFLLILAGIIMGVQISAHLDRISTNCDSHIELVGQIRHTAVYTIIAGAAVVIGIVILLCLFLRLFCKTVNIEKEANALRIKNEAVGDVVRQTRQLAHHQRLETIGMLTSSIAHEFNNLLTPIMGYSLMALEKLQPDDQLYDDLLEIYDSSCKAKEIISRLNDLSRKNTDTSFRLMSPDDLIRKTLAIAKPAKPEGVQVRLDLNCDDQRMNANEIQFTQLLLNLILNAFHAMGDEGTLSFRTSFDEDFIHINISDTGCGMSEEVQKRMFEPFFTTKESGRGTGLGLAIVAQAVEDHHGKVHVTSEPGKGTTFVLSMIRERT